ncbi:MAG: YdcF family protein [Alphaproteobacteria bacterium]|nr:YdcF family protein [Alphaproteobacteria bacterium]
MHGFSYSSLIPPNLFILLAMIGLLLAWRWRRTGLVLGTTAMAGIYLASMPIVSILLMRAVDSLAGTVPVLSSPVPAGAIVVLAAEYRHSSRPDGADIVGPVTLDRLAEAAREQRRTGLPVLVSGGWLDYAHDSLADIMAETLETDFRVPVKWRENRSRTTYEDALYSAEILRRAGVPSALVVTDPWHMARALWSFYAVGYPVVAAPLPYRQPLHLALASFLPQVPALQGSNIALHELIGLAWYELRSHANR